MQDKLVCQPP